MPCQILHTESSTHTIVVKESLCEDSCTSEEEDEEDDDEEELLLADEHQLQSERVISLNEVQSSSQQVVPVLYEEMI